MVQQKQIQLVSMRLWVQPLASLSGLEIQCCHDLWYRSCILDPSLLWLWHRLAAVAPIQPLAWGLPYATGVALKRGKKEIETEKRNNEFRKKSSMSSAINVKMYCFSIH